MTQIWVLRSRLENSRLTSGNIPVFRGQVTRAIVSAVDGADGGQGWSLRLLGALLLLSLKLV